MALKRVTLLKAMGISSSVSLGAVRAPEPRTVMNKIQNLQSINQKVAPLTRAKVVIVSETQGYVHAKNSHNQEV